jgi:hypothetical protein
MKTHYQKEIEILVSISKNDGLLLLSYAPRGGAGYLGEQLAEDDEVRVTKIFVFEERHIYERDDDEWIFKLGVLKGDFYIIEKDILGISHDLRIHSSCTINSNIFIANRGISVFKNIDKVTAEPITVGGHEEPSIPEKKFKSLLKQFPTHIELNHYVRSRITRILNDYFETTTDAQSKFETYLKKRTSDKETSKETPIEPLSKEYEVEKYEFIRDELIEMLKNSEAYLEDAWQKKILKFIRLLFPKYVAVLENLHIKDFYSNTEKVTKREIDIALVDANGHIDVIEIKRPFANCLVSKGKYRNNFVPKRELSGSVMQVEKYLFHLSKWGQTGEQEILKKRKNELPNGLMLRVTNPKGLIIAGREDGLSSEQLFDFEFMKRKYANIIDIITYDDLLKRLDNIIEMMKR